jgi:hypothetical protein
MSETEAVMKIFGSKRDEVTGNLGFYIISNFVIYTGHLRNCKVVSVLNQAPRHEGVLGSGGIAPCILDLSTRWR